MKFVTLYLVVLISSASCRIYSIENEDGSYSIGLNSDSRGETANSILALLTKSAGYTLDSSYEDESHIAQESPGGYTFNTQDESNMGQKNSQVFLESSQPSNLLAFEMDKLRLIEAFLQFKKELITKIYDFIANNYGLIRNAYTSIAYRIGTLHSFALTGVQILRKLLEIAAGFMAQWQANFSAGNQQQTSFSFDKNTNFY